MNKGSAVIQKISIPFLCGFAALRLCVIPFTRIFRRIANLTTATLAVSLMLLPQSSSAADLAEKEQQAIREAVAKIAPCVVRIETIGGMERVGEMLFGTGPTTGLVVDPNGYIVSSVFNFVNRPTSILVRLPDGSRKAAQLVATDHSRMVALLKIDVSQPLPVPVVAPQSELRVGQWTIAVGRTFEADTPNVSVGILSAVGRIWGKALQTDSAVSPNNYGGPLIDLAGHVLGILVPLSPDADSEVSGVEWYDSGIGFAIPAEHLWKMLPRLKKGENLDRGLMGVSFNTRDLYAEQPAISAVHPRSPADDAALRAGDKIVEIDHRKIDRAAQVREEINRRYAGDKMRVTVLRGKDRLTRDVTLIAKLPPYEYPSLGMLPTRPADEGQNDQSGVAVRWVDPAGPSAKAGLRPGDVLLKLDEKPIAGRDDLAEQLTQSRPDAQVKMEVRRRDQTLSLTVRLARLSDSPPPAHLPPSHEAIAPTKTAHPKVGIIPVKLPQTPNTIWACVPSHYEPAVACGIIVWLHGPGEFDPKQFVERWQALSDRHDLIVVAPKASEASKWQTNELRMVRRLIEQLSVDYTVDPSRIAVSGQGSGSQPAMTMAFRFRELIRGAAIIDGQAVEQFPPTSPGTRTLIYAAHAEKSRFAMEVQQSVARLREAGYPVTTAKRVAAAGDLTPDELDALARWVDMLDRL
jgi:serine protease Do